MTENPSIVQRQPVVTAGSITAAVSLGLFAVFLVARDWGIVVPQDTREAITAFLVAGVALFTAWWAQRRSTPMASPSLAAGTSVNVLDERGATLGHADVPTPEG